MLRCGEGVGKYLMNKSNQPNSNFLSKFIKEEKYLQNPPLEANEFKNNCRKRGIITDERELEFFEKERLLFPIFRIDLPIIKKDEKEIDGFKTNVYSSYGFGADYHKLLLNWLEEGNLYDPSIKSFKCWKNYKDDIGREKTVSFYSSYQIYWLSMLKKTLSFNINFIGDDIKVNYFLPNSYDFEDDTASFSIKEISEKKPFRENFDLKEKKKRLKKEYKIFNLFLKFLITIQNIYYPYVRSGSKTINISGDRNKWLKMKKDFNLDNELKYLGLKIEDVARWYFILSKISQKMLGASGSDWAQLWKNISWDKKEKLKGNNRLGIDYLQCAVMLKRVIEEYLVREIPDIDEITNFDPEDVLTTKINIWNCQPDSLRSIRNGRFIDIDLENEKLLNSIFKKIVKPVVNKTEIEEEFSKFEKMGFYIDWCDKTICFDEKKLNIKNYYHDKYKRLFYLSNTFRLDYQPRVFVFVEGKTEEKILPKIFEWYYGETPDSLGIEFIDFKGVDQLLSTSKNAEILRDFFIDIQIEKKQKELSNKESETLNKIIRNLKKVDIVISNWTSFLSYNLKKWQIIPFFLSDNEGNVKHFLEAETPIRFTGKNYNIPQEWRFLWGVDNQDAPFMGNSFELANFSALEITTAINEILKSGRKEEEIYELRESKKGINALGPEVKDNKIEINEKLVDNMFNSYEKDKDDSLFKRPIFNVIKKIFDLTVRNHPPGDRRIELENKNYIENILSKPNNA